MDQPQPTNKKLTTHVVPSLLIAVACLALYTLAIPLLPDPNTSVRGGTDQQQNVMQAEQYLYDIEPPSTIIVGSSIGARVKKLPEGWFNLCLSGGNPILGLEIILVRGERVDVVLVETNILTRKVDEQLLDRLLSEPGHSIRRELASLRETHRPAHQPFRIVFAAMEAYKRGKNPKYAEQRERAESLEPLNKLLNRKDRPPVGEAAHARLVRDRLAFLATPMTPEQVARTRDRIDRLRSACERLRAQGTRVVFFNCPEYPGAFKQARKTQMMQLLHEELPPSEWTYIAMPDADDFVTTDGMHLTDLSADIYTHYLLEQVGRLGVGP